MYSHACDVTQFAFIFYIKIDKIHYAHKKYINYNFFSMLETKK